MKNKLAILSILILLLLCGCNGNIVMEESSTEEIEDQTGMIDLSKCLTWDKNTHIIYTKQYTHGGNYIYIPYISSNGKYIRYENGEFVEVEENNDNKSE